MDPNLESLNLFCTLIQLYSTKIRQNHKTEVKKTSQEVGPTVNLIFDPNLIVFEENLIGHKYLLGSLHSF